MFLDLLQLAGLIRLAVLDSAGMAIWHWYSTHTQTLVYHAHTRVAIWHWYTTHTHTAIPHTHTSISFARSTHMHIHARIHTYTQTQTYTHLPSLSYERTGNILSPIRLAVIVNWKSDFAVIVYTHKHTNMYLCSVCTHNQMHVNTYTQTIHIDKFGWLSMSAVEWRFCDVCRHTNIVYNC